ncbi:MAG: bifunctional DNA primase/polymerase, partial [Pseudoclavibacter sp.]
MTDGSSIMTAAATAWAAGLSIIPVRPGTDKAPAVAWKEYQTRRADAPEFGAWFRDEHHGLGIITGAISGRLEMLELEGRAADQQALIGDLANASGLADVWTRITTGWVEQSPSGGVHWQYRLADDGNPMPRNTKIARDADGLVLAETRGEAGYFVAAPTP